MTTSEPSTPLDLDAIRRRAVESLRWIKAAPWNADEFLPLPVRELHEHDVPALTRHVESLARRLGVRFGELEEARAALRQATDERDTARAEVERLRAVIAAAQEWRAANRLLAAVIGADEISRPSRALMDALDALDGDGLQ